MRNRLDVVPPEQLEPDAIREQVRAVLNRDPYLQDYRFDIDVVGNTVHLAGEVRNLFERDRAERILATVKGVDEIKTVDIAGERGARYYQPYADEFPVFDYPWYATIRILPAQAMRRYWKPFEARCAGVRSWIAIRYRSR